MTREDTLKVVTPLDSSDHHSIFAGIPPFGHHHCLTLILARFQEVGYADDHILAIIIPYHTVAQ